ncbi:MAG: prepilin-type N-terminal cleavage/methylation domain-containing protein [Candidatus Omnitrophica bacterium]|nr:prepilin-type N-terminal cleavage/methylation domain-containing protein [Candidatus Omnitrophota bacterium]
MMKRSFTPLDKKKLSNNNYLTGFTLIEVLVSALLLALVTTGLVYVFFAAKKHIMHARSRMQVAELSRFFLTPFQNQVRQDQWGSNCLGAGVDCTVEAQVIDNVTYTPSYDPGDVAGTALRKIKVTINWSE